MKIIFEKFYKLGTADTVDGKKLFATSSVLPSGKAVLVSATSFVIVDLPADLASLVEMTREEWIAAKEPIGITIYWNEDSVEVPAKRELTSEEENLDKEYQTRLHEARTARMQAIRQALADPTVPLVEVETTTTTGYSSVPLMAALGQLFAPDPDPVDPISWRRVTGKAGKLTMLSALVEVLGSIVSQIMDRKAKVQAEPAPKAGVN